LRCDAGEDYDAGLCYRPCNKKGFKGVGPVCWGSCPTGWKDCGAGCGRKEGDCSGKVTNMIRKVGEFALEPDFKKFVNGTLAFAYPLCSSMI